MWTLFYSFLFATVFVFGASAEQRMQEGKPILPKLSGFSPGGYLPGNDQEHIEEVYDNSQSSQPESFTIATSVDPDVDAYIQEWVAEYERAGVPDHGGRHAPESLVHQGVNKSENFGETKSETFETPILSLENLSQEFHQNCEILGEKNRETPGIFNIDDDPSDDEWATFFQFIDDGLSVKGKDIIWEMWGIKPGKNYGKGMQRRNMYADRIKAGETPYS